MFAVTCAGTSQIPSQHAWLYRVPVGMGGGEHAGGSITAKRYYLHLPTRPAFSSTSTYRGHPYTHLSSTNHICLPRLLRATTVRPSRVLFKLLAVTSSPMTRSSNCPSLCINRSARAHKKNIQSTEVERFRASEVSFSVSTAIEETVRSVVKYRRCSQYAWHLFHRDTRYSSARPPYLYIVASYVTHDLNKMFRK